MAYEQINSMTELRELLGVPAGRAVTKAVQETPETLEDYYAPANYARRLY